MDLASPAVSGTSVYANGLRQEAQAMLDKKRKCYNSPILICF